MLRKRYLMLLSLLVVLMKTLTAGEKVDALDFWTIDNSQKCKSWEGKIVRVRGFLYVSPLNQWLLSNEPQVKTCCIGKLVNPLLLEGHFNSNLVNQAIEVEGILSLNENHRYFLKNATLIKKERNLQGILFMGTALIGIFAWLFKQKNWR